MKVLLQSIKQLWKAGGGDRVVFALGPQFFDLTSEAYSE
jgi:hypothetical protein